MAGTPQAAQDCTQKHSRYVRVTVRHPVTERWTSVSLDRASWQQALGYTQGQQRKVTDALRYVAERITAAEAAEGPLSKTVKRKALARLRGQVQSPAERLARENNAVWMLRDDRS